MYSKGYNKYKKSKAKYKGNSLQSYLMQKGNLLTKQFPGKFYFRQIKVDRKKDEEPCDFYLLSSRGVWFLEAKECSKEKLYLSIIPQHQKDAIYLLGNFFEQSHAGFVVWFMTGEKSNFDIDALNGRIRYIDKFQGKKFFTKEDGVPFGFDLFF
jgi:hypothetical protein